MDWYIEWLIFSGECRYTGIPYMDPMGSMFSLRPWSKVTFGCKFGADKHRLFNFPYWKEPDGPGDWSCDLRWSICMLVTQLSQKGHQQPNHGKKGNVDSRLCFFFYISFCFWLDVCWEHILEDEPTNPFVFSTPTDEMIQHSVFLIFQWRS